VALSYVWLCCGVIVLVVAGLVLVWLARRGRRGRGQL
jgi:heme exporter protein D